jgi:hypothetical protein
MANAYIAMLKTTNDMLCSIILIIASLLCLSPLIPKASAYYYGAGCDDSRKWSLGPEFSRY